MSFKEFQFQFQREVGYTDTLGRDTDSLLIVKMLKHCGSMIYKRNSNSTINLKTLILRLR